ncbi:hypothetical protein AAF712_009296 [Marasmius tenuissimus]|uniref:Chromo domain-containing protein n=1 Tax=Marasmius tenuissimus TaxID=585030 RepID=A0ABR2ZRE7_9AGAR
MGNNKEQYEVETVLGAKVLKKGARSKARIWKYNVKWKGYDDPEENTWEPEESFEGSEHFIANFWKKVDTGGREPTNLELFKLGEELTLPEPRNSRKAPRTSNETSDPTTSTPASTRKRKRSAAVSPQRKPLERTKPSKPRNSRKRPRTETPIDSPPPSSNSPDVDEDHVMSTLCIDTDNDEPQVSTSQKPSRNRRRESSFESKQSPERVVIASSPVVDDERLESPGGIQQSVRHSRATNPLVKTTSDEIKMDGAISTKTRLFASSSTEEATARSTRSQTRYMDTIEQRNKGTTLLTVQKGKLTSVRGKLPARKASPPGQTVERDPVEPSEDFIQDYMTAPAASDGPSGQHVDSSPEELLRLAGLDEGADDLQDYDDDVPVSESSAPNADASGGSESIFQQSLTLAKDKLFPSTLTSASQSITNALSAAWRRSTIFGPLATGSLNNEVGDDTTRSQSFTLHVDVAVALPVVLIPHSAEPQIVVSNTPNNPPGKFYVRETALAVLTTLRTGGPCATVTPSPECSEGQNDAFLRFAERLANDELFVAIAGSDVLAFCSSSSQLISQRLNFPPSLILSSPASVLVGRVTIQDHSAYATVALQA